MEDLSHSHQTITTELDAIGGEGLAGSGFQAETPEPDFVSSESEIEE